MVHFVFQNGAFCVLKWCILRSKTVRFAFQKCQFCNAKVAVLQNGTQELSTD